MLYFALIYLSMFCDPSHLQRNHRTTTKDIRGYRPFMFQKPYPPLSPNRLPPKKACSCNNDSFASHSFCFPRVSIGKNTMAMAAARNSAPET